MGIGAHALLGQLFTHRQQLRVRLWYRQLVLVQQGLVIEDGEAADAPRGQGPELAVDRVRPEPNRPETLQMRQPIQGDQVTGHGVPAEVLPVQKEHVDLLTGRLRGGEEGDKALRGETVVLNGDAGMSLVKILKELEHARVAGRGDGDTIDGDLAPV